jgi:hypothetical protein
MDNRYGAKDWFVDDFEKNFFLPAEFEYSLFCGLANTDAYVWVYTEHLKWWTNEKVPPPYLEALRQARNPRVIDDARYLGRKVKDAPARNGAVAAAQPGYSDADTFDDLKTTYELVADLPKTWRFRTDAQKQGETAGWHRPGLDLTDWREIEIGRFWDEQGVSFEGDAWYRLAWTVPAVNLPPNARLFLWFGAVDEIATVWVNGRSVGGHDEPPDLGWNRRFAVEVTGALTPGAEVVVAVRVGNSALAGGIWKSVKLGVAR